MRIRKYHFSNPCCNRFLSTQSHTCCNVPRSIANCNRIPQVCCRFRGRIPHGKLLRYEKKQESSKSDLCCSRQPSIHPRIGRTGFLPNAHCMCRSSAPCRFHWHMERSKSLALSTINRQSSHQRHTLHLAILNCTCSCCCLHRLRFHSRPRTSLQLRTTKNQSLTCAAVNSTPAIAASLLANATRESINVGARLNSNNSVSGRTVAAADAIG